MAEELLAASVPFRYSILTAEQRKAPTVCVEPGCQSARYVSPSGKGKTRCAFHANENEKARIRAKKRVEGRG